MDTGQIIAFAEDIGLIETRDRWMIVRTCMDLDGIKVGRQFVAGIGQNVYDEAILEGLVTFGRTAALPLIAEGVETEAQVQWLADKRYQGIQGYSISRPSTLPLLAPISAL
jgi:EAL domain-containing protein (putative c-di-GMP-specific phosphodiesterase class I)